MANVLVAGSALLSAGEYISAVLNVKKGLDECRLLARVPDELRECWLLLDALVGPLEACTRLCARHAAMPCLQGATIFARTVVNECRPLLHDGDDDAEEDGPGIAEEESASAFSWLFRTGADGVSLKSRLPALQQRLVRAMTALQLALAAAAATLPAGFSAATPFRFVPAAAEAAAEALNEFYQSRQTQRLLCGAAVHRLGNSSSRHGVPQLVLLGMHGVWLRVAPANEHGRGGNGGSGGLELMLAPSAEDDVESDEDDSPLELRLDHSLLVRRLRAANVPQLELEPEALVYKLSSAPEAPGVRPCEVIAGASALFLVFEPTEMSAETFETLLFMACATDGKLDGGGALVELYEPAHPQALERFRRQMEEHVGLLPAEVEAAVLGTPGSRAARARATTSKLTSVDTEAASEALAARLHIGRAES